MITDFILNTLYNFVYVILTPIRDLGDVVLPSDITNAITTTSNYLANINALVPLSTLFAILAIYIIIEGGIFGYKGIQWLIKKIPTIN